MIIPKIILLGCLIVNLVVGTVNNILNSTSNGSTIAIYYILVAILMGICVLIIQNESFRDKKEE